MRHDFMISTRELEKEDDEIFMEFSNTLLKSTKIYE